MIWFKKAEKYIHYLTTKLSVKFRQKVFRSNDIELKYMLFNARKSRDLVVVFSACTRGGLKARYNYVRTLKHIKCNKLFILDDFASDERGCYYLGRYPDYPIEKATVRLIENVRNATSSEKIILCGSSKGGWSCLNFAFDLPFCDDIVVCSGAPQYRLGSYLKYFTPAMDFICGPAARGEVIADLDVHLQNKILGAGNDISGRKKPKIYLHYSANDGSTISHVKALLSDLNAASIPYSSDVQSYASHHDVSLFFPDYLKSTVEKELSPPRKRSRKRK